MSHDDKSEKLHELKLKFGNYNDWVMVMTSLLKKKRLWNSLNKECPKETTDKTKQAERQKEIEQWHQDQDDIA